MITLTESASTHIQKSLNERGKGIGIRFGIRTSGCTGYAYVIEFVDEHNDDDHIIEDRGIRAFVDQKSLSFLQGSTVDYTKEGLNEGFKFINPNVKDECGCGESFNI
jgi:iron-sulfur cluster assembly protein